MSRTAAGTVELRDLTEAPELAGLTVLHLVSERSPVRDLALVSDFEDVGSVGPDTVVLLAAGGARGGWMISAALRYAWERRVCALIVPEQPFTASVVDLARRFEVSLLTTRRDMTRLAIDAAMRIGTARAESAARVRAVIDRLSSAPDPARAASILSDELDGAHVWIESAGVRTFGAPAESSVRSAPREDAPSRTEVVRADLSPRDDDALLARVPPRSAAFGEQLLAEAAPSMRALLLEQRLATTLASLPVIAITSLANASPFTALHAPVLTGLETSRSFPLDGDFLAVCLLSDEPDRFGALVHQLWFLAHPEAPLARFDGGWISFLPAGDRERLERDLSRIRDGFGRVAGLPISGGFSRQHRSRAEAHEAAREAWLAARIAEPVCATGGTSAVPVDPDAPAGSASTNVCMAFDAIPIQLLDRLVPADLAAQLAAALFPALVSDASAAPTIEAVLAYLSARGSISAAAAHLGVHRNTLQARLKRAEQLGVDLSTPSSVLPTHLLLAAVQRGTVSVR